MRLIKSIQIICCSLLPLLLTHVPASAHQPYFEENEWSEESPYKIKDVSVSLALYGTLSTKDNVDYFVFDGEAGQSVYLQLVIPFIDGHDHFTPTLALMGPGLEKHSVPKPVVQPAQTGALILRADPGTPTIFYEPFGARNYYERQELTLSLPASGQYTIAIWSESGQIGRYTFSPGKREIFGGDRNYWQKSQLFWSVPPTPQPTNTPAAKNSFATPHCFQ